MLSSVCTTIHLQLYMEPCLSCDVVFHSIFFSSYFFLRLDFKYLCKTLSRRSIKSKSRESKLAARKKDSLPLKKVKNMYSTHSGPIYSTEAICFKWIYSTDFFLPIVTDCSFIIMWQIYCFIVQFIVTKACFLKVLAFKEEFRSVTKLGGYCFLVFFFY